MSLSLKNRSGFTLIELLVVISVVGLLSIIILSVLTVARSKGRDANKIVEIINIQSALELYRSTEGSYPQTLTAAAAIGTWPGELTEAAAAVVPWLEVEDNMPENMSTVLKPLVTSKVISSISNPGNTFYAYVSNKVTSMGTCDTVDSTLYEYVLYFNTENPQSNLTPGTITKPTGVPSTNLYCIFFK